MTDQQQLIKALAFLRQAADKATTEHALPEMNAAAMMVFQRAATPELIYKLFEIIDRQHNKLKELREAKV